MHGVHVQFVGLLVGDVLYEGKLKSETCRVSLPNCKNMICIHDTQLFYDHSEYVLFVLMFRAA